MAFSQDVCDGKSLYFPIQASVRVAYKEIYKKCCDVCVSMASFSGQFKPEPHPHWSPLGVSCSFSDHHRPVRVVSIPEKNFPEKSISTSFGHQLSREGRLCFHTPKN